MTSHESLISSDDSSDLAIHEPVIPYDLNLLDTEILTKNVLFGTKCVRDKSNFSEPLNNSINLIDPNPKNSKKPILSFDERVKLLKETYPQTSPKIVKMLEMIKKVDEDDMKKFGKRFKHFIFTDLRSNLYGAKMIGSVLIANGFVLGYDSSLTSKQTYSKLSFKSDDKLEESKYDNFYILNTSGVYDQTFNRETKKRILGKFNSRPDNVYGELIRFIVMDSGYKEGIDLFDIKYIHIFEPQTTLADLKQVIGRGTRLCGQKGLNFDPKHGWSLNVFIYDLNIPENIRPLFQDSKTAFELYLKSMNYDVSLFNFQNALENVVVESAVDSELNENINKFKPTQANENQFGGDLELDELKNKLTHDELKKAIKKNFKQYTWDKIKVENLCVDTNESQKKSITYSNTQQFIRDYFTPEIYQKGMLLWHSVGTGKTCTAILTASSTFERENYTILWVTRTTLVNDIWKNMFGNTPNPVCNKNIKELMEKIEFPTDLKSQKKFLSKSWKINPLSYKQFTNLISKSNRFYQMLTKINGTIDPLRKTLIIIDEAHKLYGESDLSAIERPNMKLLHNALMNSYEVSGKDSAKLLLMTATPITKDPMELIKLVNLCKPIDEQLPNDFYSFKSQFLDENGFFKRKDKFMDEIAGYISYLDRSFDIRQFSQPKLHYIYEDIIEKDNFLLDYQGVKKLNKILKSTLAKTKKQNRLELSKTRKLFQRAKKEIKEVKNNLNPSKLKLDIENKKVKAEMNKLIRNTIKEVVDDFNKTMKADISAMNEISKKKFEPIISNATSKQDFEKFKNTPYYQITEKCSYKEDRPDLKTYYLSDATIQNYQDSIKAKEAEFKQYQKLSLDNISILRNKIKLLKKQQSKLSSHSNSPEIRECLNEIKQTRKNITTENDMKSTFIRKANKKTKKRMKIINERLKEQIKERKKLEKEFLKKELEKIKSNQIDYSPKLKNHVNETINTLEKSVKDIIEEGYKKEVMFGDEKERKLREKEETKLRKQQEKEETKLRKQQEIEAVKLKKLQEKEEAKLKKLKEKEEAKERKMKEKEMTRKSKKGGKRQTRKRRIYYTDRK